MTYPIKERNWHIFLTLSPLNWKVPTNTPKYADIDTSGCPPALGLTDRITTTHAKKINMLQNITQGLELGTGTLERVKSGNPRYKQVQNLSSSRLLSEHTQIKI